MSPRENAGVPVLVRKPTGALLLLGLTGILLSLYVGRQEARQHQALEKLQIVGMVDAHFAAVQDHLSLRENLAIVVAALFNPPPLSTPNPLGQFGDHVAALVSDISTMGWLPEVPVARAGEALQSLKEAGVENPRFIGRDGQPVALESLDRPLYPILDVAPQSNRWILGVDAGDFPDRFTAIQDARQRRAVTRTSPIRLVQAPAADAILLYAPVFAKDDNRFLGVLGFGYKLETLFTSALTASRASRDFDIRVFSRLGVPLIALASDGTLLPIDSKPGEDHTLIERTSDFGGRELKFVYSVPRDLRREGFWRGLAFVFMGCVFTGGAVTLLGFLTNRAAMLAHEVSSRRSAEERMKILIHELNHRVRNVLSVAQAVVRLSFTPENSLSEIQKNCEGRLQALANAMSLLTASEWKSVNLHDLIIEDIVPFADRMTIKGPDLALKPRSAQTFALLLYELATNAAKHGAFSVPQGKVMLTWEIDRSGREPLFRMIWREIEGPAIAAPARRGFGEMLVRRIAPRDVGGRGRVSYEAQGFEYELEAPLKEILYSADGSQTRAAVKT